MIKKICIYVHIVRITPAKLKKTEHNTQDTQSYDHAENYHFKFYALLNIKRLLLIINCVCD